LPGVQQHDAVADGDEIMLHLIVLESRLLGEDVFQEFAQPGNVPLLVPQVVDQFPDGVLWSCLEDFVE